MNRIALAMLFGDRGKTITMIVGITFAALIMTQQPSIFVGLMTRTFSFLGDIADVDVWVMDPGVQYVEEHKPLRDTDLARVRGVDGVKWAAPMYKNFFTAKLPDGSTRTIAINGLDDATLIGAPPMVEGKLEDIRKADGVIVDREAAETKLRVRLENGKTRALKVGDELELNDKRAVVVGLAKVTRDFTLQPAVFTTYSRALSYTPPQRRKLTYVMVKAQPETNHRDLARGIEKATGLKAMTHEDFKTLTLNYWMTETGIPINFGISVALGFFVGAAIAGQAFFGFVRENFKQYATLKAMGLRNGALVKMVMLQAAIVGGIGYGIGVGITTLFGLKMRDSILAFRMPPELLLFSGAGVLIIITISALLAIRYVIKVDPSVVFRG